MTFLHGNLCQIEYSCFLKKYQFFKILIKLALLYKVKHKLFDYNIDMIWVNFIHFIRATFILRTFTFKILNVEN